MVNLAFASDAVASKMLTKEVMKSLKLLCAHKEMKVQQLALLAVGNLAFCWENRRTLVASEILRELLVRLTAGPTSCISKAAARALIILGEDEYLRRANRVPGLEASRETVLPFARRSARNLQASLHEAVF